jgi:hypothetical protein
MINKYLLRIILGGIPVEIDALTELMNKIKLLSNEEINKVIQYCRVMKKANDIKDGKKTPRKKRVKSSG